MKKNGHAGILALLLVAAVWVSAEDNTLYRSLRATIFVKDMDSAVAEISGWTEDRGGFILYSSGERVVLRFPQERLTEFVALLETMADQVIEIAPQALDLREAMLGLESRIRSREEILERNLSFLDQTDVEGTLDIEQEVQRLLREIESLKGTLGKYSADVLLARGEVDLRLVRQSIPSDLTSSFEWINSVDFYSFVRRR